MEAGSGLGHDQKQSSPADILVNNWGINGTMCTSALIEHVIGTYASRFHIGILQYHECH